MIKAACEPLPYKDDQAWAVYGSSKTEGEKALRKFMKEQKPRFVANAILSNANFGTILKGQPTTTGKWIKDLYEGNTDAVKRIPPRKLRYRLGVTSLTDPNLQNGL
jgi:hypothetical protein